MYKSSEILNVKVKFAAGKLLLDQRFHSSAAGYDVVGGFGRCIRSVCHFLPAFATPGPGVPVLAT